MSLRSLLLGLPLAVGFLGLPGCGAAPDEEGAPEQLGNASTAIKDGYLDSADTGAVGVGIFQQGSLVGICTGSLIAPNVVLTAHHCVADVQNEDPQLGIVCSKTSFSAPYGAVAMAVTTKPTMGDSKDTSYHKVKEVIVQEGTKLLCGNDQAILILADNIDPSEAKLLVPRVDTEIAKKDEYYAIGYGATQDDQNGTGAGTRRRRDKLFISCPGAECPSAFKSAIKPAEFMGDQGICEGDSGGPALDLQNRVIGITSRGGAGCTTPVYSDVFGAGEWVKATTAHGAKVGGYTAPAWTTGFPTDPQFSTPVGAACTQPSDCESSNCLAGTSASYCTRPCNDAATCPDGYTCDTAKLGVCVQIPPPPLPVVTTPPTATSTSGDTAQASGCSIGAGDDPTKPVPWFTGSVVLAALAWRRRRAA
jgi:MYXO-CTERM domain-containing protein